MTTNEMVHGLAVTGRALVAAGKVGLGRALLSQVEALSDELRPTRSTLEEAAGWLARGRGALGGAS